MERSVVVVSRAAIREFISEKGQKSAYDFNPIEKKKPLAPVEVGAVEVENWKEIARTKAQAIIKRDYEKDLFPSQLNIADEIAEEFRNAKPQVVGVGGKPLTAAYIKRHALKNISSELGKQLSTPASRGK